MKNILYICKVWIKSVGVGLDNDDFTNTTLGCPDPTL